MTTQRPAAPPDAARRARPARPHREPQVAYPHAPGVHRVAQRRGAPSCCQNDSGASPLRPVPGGGAAMTGDQWDAIVVGAGHNGLTAGALLARAGLSTLVLERRDVIGGACVTEEIAAGCRASTTSYIASMLRPEVIRTLELGKHGLRMVPCEPAVQVALEGGEVLANWTDQERTRAEITRLLRQGRPRVRRRDQRAAPALRAAAADADRAAA